MTEKPVPQNDVLTPSLSLSPRQASTLMPEHAPLVPKSHHRAPAQSATGYLPNTVIIGAMKSGTTTLHDHLDLHPSITMSARKETNFFVAHQSWKYGLEWYKGHFPEPNLILGESSPNYARYPLFPGVPERMHRTLPDAKLILCVRDPIKRMVSHYVHSYSLGRESRPLEEALLAQGDNAYLLCSRYYYQLEQYFAYFDASRFHVVVLEELSAQPQQTMQGVFRFLGVDASFFDPRYVRPSATMPAATTRRRSPLKSWMVRRKMRGVYWLERNVPWIFGPPIPKPELSPAARSELAERLAPDVTALRAFTGKSLASWSL